MDASFYETFPLLETARLRLRELTAADAALVFEMFADPEVTRFYDVATMTDPGQAELLTERLRRRFHDRTGIRWAIERKADGAAVGTCGFPALVASANRGSIGYELARRAWGHGLASEAIAAIVELGHRTAGLRRIDALVATGNDASMAALRKCQFRNEGVLRDYAILQGQYCDMVMFAHVEPIGAAQTSAPVTTIRCGELFWIAPDASRTPSADYPHPHVVVQDDVFNQSRIATVVVCALSSNLQKASEPGNVLLDDGEGGLPRRSVVVVSQISSLDRAQLGDRIGALSEPRVDQIRAGLRFQQASFARR